MKAELIAEPAIYWHGNISLLYNMITVAAQAQAEYFKLQLFNTKYLTGKFRDKKKFYESCQLNDGDLLPVKECVEKLGMKLLCTVMTPDQLDRLANINVNSIKIASGQINTTLIQEINSYGWDEVFVSTGMTKDVSSLMEIKNIECKRVNILHCVSLYPQYDPESNIFRMGSLKKLLGDKYHYGYSDHSLDDLACMVAVSQGAEYVERHFKVDGCFGPTSQVASDPNELCVLGAMLRRIETICGTGDLLMQPREQASYEHYKNRFLF